MKFGLIPEFVGRVPVIVSLDQLDEEALVRILTEPKNALIKQYKRLFELDEVELVFTEEAAREVARQSSKRKMGARGLRSIIEKAMMKVMFEIPSDPSIASCTITEDVIKGTGEPVLVRRDVDVPAGKLRKASRRTGETA
jgi:ATP-dependent Clp protease ATP-binding subunit ClpX